MYNYHPKKRYFKKNTNNNLIIILFIEIYFDIKTNKKVKTNNKVKTNKKVTDILTIQQKKFTINRIIEFPINIYQ